jgi:uncharacterized protein
MTMKRRPVCAALAALAAGLPARAAGPAEYREIQWDALVPKDWDPLKRFRDKNLDTLDDSDPKVLEMMRELRATWDNAPTVAKMDGAAVKLPGYLVPLEQARGELKEFLLVPYFGACIHSPPPPANQIVHVVAVPPVKGFHSMDAVWVSGTLKTLRQESSMGVSGYRMRAVGVVAYEAGRRP